MPDQEKSTVVVTGGSRGIGRAICIALAGPKTRIFFNYFSPVDPEGEAAAAAETIKAVADVGGEAFRRLFDYISEGDRPQGKIAMTTPVIQQPLPAVTEQSAIDDVSPGAEKRYRFAFVMPVGYSLEELPRPENAEVRIESVPARLMAARRYSGTWSEERYRSNERQLLAAVQAAGLKTLGPPIFARYNAPFSLWFLRRNEVLVEVAAP